ncbi:hypothetical protein TNCV_946031 [Trichonephila clavipes]|nr:hypothetical protein TNCV_946031 [Trichonephila clavipes]
MGCMLEVEPLQTRQVSQNSKATKIAHNICVVNGEGTTAERTARDCRTMFKNKSFDLKDAPRSGRPVEFDEEL